jgi:predicted DNA-binding transcriptional regulator AlpA
MSPEELLDWLAKAPAGTLLDVVAVRAFLEHLGHQAHASSAAAAPVETTWRERLWTAPAETRIGVRELAEAVGRTRSWVYRRTAPNGQRAPLPHRKLDGELVFVVGQIRTWLQGHESDIVPLIRPPHRGRR